MRRLVIAGVVALAAGSATAAFAMGSSRARVSGFVCQQALDPAARAVSIKAVMRPLPGTMKLAMRFSLIKRSRRHGHGVSISGPRLKTWITPKPSKGPAFGSQPGDVWVVKHPVVGLAAPAFYQFKVAFRWSNASGKVIATAVRRSPVCSQPELRPDLAVTAITPSGSAGGYVATIRNKGHAAGAFQVQLSEGASVLHRWYLPQLAAHHSHFVYFKAPGCSASNPATIAADPSGQIDDANRSNNSMQTSCSGVS